jgi:sulfide:quinone oxidoreductase
VALPELYGPAVPGLPEAPDGFIPVDTNCQVRGVERVYAAGDTTDFAIKYGGIAAQQADTAAQAIAALAGAPVQPETFHPVIHGMLLTGALPRYLRADITGGQPITSEITLQPTWSSPDKIVARYLAPYLDRTFGSGPGRPGGPS